MVDLVNLFIIDKFLDSILAIFLLLILLPIFATMAMFIYAQK